MTLETLTRAVAFSAAALAVTVYGWRAADHIAQKVSNR